MNCGALKTQMLNLPERGAMRTLGRHWRWKGREGGCGNKRSSEGTASSPFFPGMVVEPVGLGASPELLRQSLEERAGSPETS